MTTTHHARSVNADCCTAARSAPTQGLARATGGRAMLYMTRCMQYLDKEKEKEAEKEKGKEKEKTKANAKKSSPLPS